MSSTRTLLAIATTLATFAGGLAVADAAEAPPVIEHLSDGPGTDAEEDTEFGGISPDATRTFFETSESLVATDTDTRDDVYARNADGTLTHISDDPTGADAEQGANFNAVSADGTRVFFNTNESLDPDDTDASEDQYRRNADGSLTFLTDDPTGGDAELFTSFESVSADGTRLAFRTPESLAATDTDSVDDIYARNADGSLTHVSDDPTGADAENPVGFGRISADGARVIFNTNESLAGTDTDTFIDVYARNANGSLTHVTDDPTGADAALHATFLAVSKDGTHAFFSTDESLAATDTDASGDVYRRDGDGTLVHVSDNPTGPDAELGPGLRGISDDGTRAIISTNESLAATDTDSENDLYRRNADGSVDHLTDDPTGPDAEVSPNFSGASSDAGLVMFGTAESLAATDTDASDDVYRRNADGSLTHVSDDPTGPDAEENASFDGASADASRVFFTTTEPLAATDTDAIHDVYARNADGSLTHLTDDPTGPDAEEGASFDASSADGTRVIFDTFESLAATDTDASEDLYVARPPVPAGPGPDPGPGPGPGPGAGPAPGPGPTAGGAGQDLLAPVFTSVTAGPGTFRLGSLLPKLSRSAPVGTTLRFTLSEAARVTFTVQAKLAGRRVGRRCVKPTRANRTRPRCTRYVTKGSFSVNARQGANRLRFQGRLTSTRRLAPGRYRIVLGAVDAAGNRSRARTVDVTILPAKR